MPAIIKVGDRSILNYMPDKEGAPCEHGNYHYCKVCGLVQENNMKTIYNS